MNKTSNSCFESVIYWATKDSVCVMAKTFKGAGCEQFQRKKNLHFNRSFTAISHQTPFTAFLSLSGQWCRPTQSRRVAVSHHEELFLILRICRDEALSTASARTIYSFIHDIFLSAWDNTKYIPNSQNFKS